tara:strand:- start:232 stop:642 length:411 start_codon:yes stop_codon:yes gene_type:complete
MSGINEWLSKNISKYSLYTNKEYIDDIFDTIYNEILINDNLCLKYNTHDILKLLYIFIYNKNIFEKISCDIIDMYYTSDVVNTYYNIKEKYGIEPLEENNITTDDLLIFLNHTVYFYEEDNYTEDEEIINMDENIM